MQIVALVALTFQQQSWEAWVSVAFVMGAQALSGVAKDLTKISSKSAVKFIAGDGALFRLVAVLTGSKNALKGVGFFVGAALLSWIGYDAALWSMAAMIAVALAAVAMLLDEDIGRAKKKPPLRGILSKSTAINRLAAADSSCSDHATPGSSLRCLCSSMRSSDGRSRASVRFSQPG